VAEAMHLILTAEYNVVDVDVIVMFANDDDRKSWGEVTQSGCENTRNSTPWSPTSYNMF